MKVIQISLENMREFSTAFLKFKRVTLLFTFGIINLPSVSGGNKMKLEELKKELFKKYEYDFFKLSDLNFNEFKTTNNSLKTQINQLEKQEVIQNSGVPGVYHFNQVDKKYNIQINPSIDELIAYLYLEDNKGYYGGISVAQRIGVSDQVPTRRKVFTTVVKRKIKKSIGTVDLIIQPARVVPTTQNIHFLEILDLINDIDVQNISSFSVNKTLDKISDYVLKTGIKLDVIKDILSQYPAKYSKKLIGMGLYDVLVRKRGAVY